MSPHESLKPARLPGLLNKADHPPPTNSICRLLNVRQCSRLPAHGRYNWRTEWRISYSYWQYSRQKIRIAWIAELACERGSAFHITLIMKMQISSQPELLFHGCSADIPLTVSSCVLSVLFFNIFQFRFEVIQYRLRKIFYGHMFANNFKLYPQCLIIYVLKIPSPKICPTQCSFDWKHRLVKMNSHWIRSIFWFHKKNH